MSFWGRLPLFPNTCDWIFFSMLWIYWLFMCQRVNEICTTNWFQGMNNCTYTNIWLARHYSQLYKHSEISTQPPIHIHAYIYWLLLYSYTYFYCQRIRIGPQPTEKHCSMENRIWFCCYQNDCDGDNGLNWKQFLAQQRNAMTYDLFLGRYVEVHGWSVWMSRTPLVYS